MPLFGSSTPFDADVEKVTSEKNTTEDWGLMMDICDRVCTQANGPKDCLRSIEKRLHNSVPFVAMQALVLLDACVNNCGKIFHLEVASREFEQEIRKIIKTGKPHPKVADRIKQLVKKWAESEFKTDPQLNIIPALYKSLRSEGVDFTERDEPPKKSTATYSKDPNVVNTQQEQDDIAKAIELSLKENKQQSPKATSSIYPTPRAPSPTPIVVASEKRKVRALYDFEAAEDNELTFKAGEIIHILDDSDPNWWKGTNQRGEGLFPANFVTADLSVEPEKFDVVEKKTVQFNENVEVKTVDIENQVVEIDESKMDRLLLLIHEADESEEVPDSEEMILLEEQCAGMGPLIDQELEKSDKKLDTLSKLSEDLMKALAMYHNLMREFPASYPYQYPKGPPPTYTYSGAPPPMSMPQPNSSQPMNGPVNHHYMPQVVPGASYTGPVVSASVTATNMPPGVGQAISSTMAGQMPPPQHPSVPTSGVDPNSHPSHSQHQQPPMSMGGRLPGPDMNNPVGHPAGIQYNSIPLSPPGSMPPPGMVYGGVPVQPGVQYTFPPACGPGPTNSNPYILQQSQAGSSGQPLL